MNADEQKIKMPSKVAAILRDELIGPPLVGVYTLDQPIDDTVHGSMVYFALENGLIFVAGAEDGVFRSSIPENARQLTLDDWDDLQFVFGQKIRSVWMDSSDPYSLDCTWLELSNNCYVTTVFSAPVALGSGVCCCTHEDFLATPNLVEVELPTSN